MMKTYLYCQRISKTPGNTIGIQANNSKTQFRRKKTKINNPVTNLSKPSQDVQKFDNVGNKVTKDSNCQQDINTRISKANQTLLNQSGHLPAAASIQRSQFLKAMSSVSSCKGCNGLEDHSRHLKKAGGVPD